MKRKSGIFTPSPSGKKKVKRIQTAEAKEENNADGKGASTCEYCQRAKKIVADMEKTLEALAEQRRETDALHKKSVEESGKLAARARAELAQSKERADALQEELDSLNAALKTSADETSVLKQELAAKQEEVIALKQSALDKENERHQQQRQSRRRSSLQLHSPAPLLSPEKVAAPQQRRGEDSGNSSSSKSDDVLSFYGMLTGLSVTPKDNGYECVLENKEKGRTLKFRIAVENGTAHYTPLTIDVPDRVPPGSLDGDDGDDDTEVLGCVLTEMVTEPIDFPTFQLPVFLSKVIDELFM